MKQMARMAVESFGWPILEPIEADGMTRPVAINKDVCVVGTRSEVNLKLKSPLVSRTHALLIADRDSIYLRDLASRNHTYLNDEPIREAVLRDGDVIAVGPLSFRCKSGFDKPYDPTEVHAPAAELRAVDGGERIPLNTRSTLIGKRKDCDVVLHAKEVEPSHAIVFEREGKRYIRDLRTVSGTWVNGVAVGQIELTPGDEIRIADAQFVFQLAGVESDLEEPDLQFAEQSYPTELPAASNGAVASENDDEHVEFELTDENSEAIPQSVGLSDWGAADLMAEPHQEAIAADDATASGPTPVNDSVATQSVLPLPGAEAEAEAIPLAAGEMNEQAVMPSMPDDGLAEPVVDSASYKVEESSQPVSPQPEELLQEVETQQHAVATVTDLPAGVGESGEIPIQDELVSDELPPAPAAADDGDLPRFEAADASDAPGQEQPLVHPGQRDRLAPEEKLTELLGELRENLEEVQSTWKEVRDQHASGSRPGTDEPRDISQDKKRVPN